MANCSVPTCGAHAVARGLCAKHYMRQRRRGDADSTGKPGRPRSEVYLKAVRQWFPDSSPRTQARWARIYRLISALEECEVIEEARGIHEDCAGGGHTRQRLGERFARAGLRNHQSSVRDAG
jgi:hypothetical protein